MNSTLSIRAEARPGSHITMAAKDAVNLAIRTGVNVALNFNGTEILVSPLDDYGKVADRWQADYEAGREALAASV